MYEYGRGASIISNLVPKTDIRVNRERHTYSDVIMYTTREEICDDLARLSFATLLEKSRIGGIVLYKYKMKQW